MVFSSVIFTFWYLPVFLAIYFILSFALGKKPTASRYARNSLLLVSSVFFYFWGETLLVLVMLTSTMIDYVAGLVIAGQWCRSEDIKPLEKDGPRSFRQKAGLFVSITANLTLLGFFKYFNFMIDSMNLALSELGFGPEAIHVWEIALPLGISFYTFQSMSYTIDVYRGDTHATRNFIDFASYVTMFPQLVAGPIIRFRNIADQLVSRTTNLEDFSVGVQRFAIGLSKKLLVADVLAVPADKIFAIPGAQLTPELAWFGVLCFSLQVYFDFSGYSDMAIGLGRMMGFRFLENFNYPLICQSIREFWQRWHISLSTWLRDYLYIPMGGNRVSKFRLFINLFTVFILCGLWHGASWMFVFWGMWHGIFLTLERLGLGKALQNVPRPFRHIYAQMVLAVHWVMFRIQDVGHAFDYNAALFGFARGDGIAFNVPFLLNGPVILALMAGIIGSMPVWRWLNTVYVGTLAAPDSKYKRVYSFFHDSAVVAYVGILLFLCAAFMSSGTYSPFIYFRF